MIKQFNNLSSWRKDEIIIDPHEVGAVSFLETLPNVFIITNTNTARLKVGISSLPRTDKYEFKIEPNCTETVGRPIGTNKLYLLNDSSKKVTVTVFSIETEFDPQILKNLNVALEGAELTTNTEISGVAEGVNLPTHDNLGYELLSDIYSGKTLLDLYNALASMSAKVGKTTGGEILEKLDLLIDKKVSLDGSGVTLNGVQTDLTTVHSHLADVKNLLGSMDNKQSDQILTLIKTAVQTSAGNTDTLKGNLNTLTTWVSKLSEQLERGQLFSRSLTPTMDAVVAIEPDSGFTKFSKIHYIRAVKGDFSIYLGGRSTDTQTSVPALTLNEGESMNDLDADIYHIFIMGLTSGAILEIVGEEK